MPKLHEQIYELHGKVEALIVSNAHITAKLDDALNADRKCNKVLKLEKQYLVIILLLIICLSLNPTTANLISLLTGVI